MNEFDAQEPWAAAPRVVQAIAHGDFASMNGQAAPTATATPRAQRRGDVAIIPLSGILTKRAAWAGTTLEAFTADLNTALADPAVASIILQVESDGGPVAGVADVAERVLAARGQKRVVAVIEDAGLGTAMWLATQASEVWANQSAVVGGIGVTAYLFDTSRATENRGERVLPIQSGRFKGIGLPGAYVTGEQIAAVQATVDAHFAIMRESVLRGRSGMTEDQFAQVADGQSLIARDALAVGLIDAVGTLNDALAAIQTGRKPAPKPVAAQPAPVSRPRSRQSAPAAKPRRAAPTRATTTAPRPVATVATAPAKPVTPAMPTRHERAMTFANALHVHVLCKDTPRHEALAHLAQQYPQLYEAWQREGFPTLPAAPTAEAFRARVAELRAEGVPAADARERAASENPQGAELNAHAVC